MLFYVVLFSASILSAVGNTDVFAQPEVSRYTPVPGGWQIRISDDAAAQRPQPGSDIGVAEGDCRLHRRPLYPPADRTMIWTPEELAKIPRSSFRPVVLAYNEPRFLFDYHAAGGLLGHLYIGVIQGSTGKWLHQWSNIDAAYVEGRMIYFVRDAAFPDTQVRLEAAPLADAAGLIVKLAVSGPHKGASLLWGYGGASAFFTNYNMTAPEFVFAPEQCAKDRVSWQAEGFALRRAFDESDAVTREAFSAWRNLPRWEAVVQGGSSWKSGGGFGDPGLFGVSPLELAASMAAATDATEQRNRVVVQQIPLSEATSETFIVVGMGGRIAGDIDDPASAWAAALERNRSIAQRVSVRTPDPYLDAAVPMMAFATEGTWGGLATVHGGWSWRFAYLGWRTGYGPVCYGWTERVRQYIEAHTTLGLVKEGPDAGALGSLLEYEPGVFYNMNEVFFDHVRQYFDYTNDLELMERIFPVLEGILEWEDTRLQPANEGLYESALNTWISDSHWYIRGQCTQASAYMLNANRFMAELAVRLRRDPAPFQARAERTLKAIQEVLWMKRLGTFAEYRDTRGHQLLHPEPELPTLYHAAEFGAADPFQTYQMLDWADTHLRTERTPGGGMLVWSSNWYPNRGRSYTHSTYEMAYGEELNYALTNHAVGRSGEAYALLRASLCGIFNGPTPGGLSCHSYVDGRQRANDEFADASSMWGRAVIEGLFGICPKRQDGCVHVTPQFPSDWTHAAITAPHFSYSWRRNDGHVWVEWESPIETAVRWRLPLAGSEVRDVRVTPSAKTPTTFEPGFSGTTWAVVETVSAMRGAVEVVFVPRSMPVPERVTLSEGSDCQLALSGSVITAWQDPQGLLSGVRLENGTLRGTAAGAPGPGVLFVLAGQPPLTTWVPLRLQIGPETPPPPERMWHAPDAGEHDLARWALVDLSGVFNSELVDAPRYVQEHAPAPEMPASQVNFGYWKDHFRETHHGGRIETLSDAAWRAKTGPDGIAWTRDGIPFKTAKEGPNIGVVTVTGGFPAKLTFPVQTAGQTLYLMISGITFPVQSHVPNVRVTLNYADGAAESTDLVNPFTIGDCWGTWCGRYHDCQANGFENLGGRHGPAGSADVQDLTQPVAVDTEAHLVPFLLKPGAELASVEFEAVANDVIFGIMGATVLK
ncbi:MAG TPA: DUF4450 domain-containing protein [Candidatus Hydrogenedentes bacterium]|nr:DUF4450 domain-containing protein [Candidatus Hydrogenedentota bacterium]